MMLHLKPKNNAKAWWENVDTHWDQFFKASATLNSTATTGALENLLARMEEAHQAVEQTAYPQDVAEARQHLLAAMNNIIIGFQKALAGDQDEASHYMDDAHAHLLNFDHTLNKLIA